MLKAAIDNAKLKIERLSGQVENVFGSEFPNNDSRRGVGALKDTIENLKKTIEAYDDLPVDRKVDILLMVNVTIETVTNILGFFVRSTTTRNLFELCFPLKEIARKLVGDDVKLVISSDWKYVPFTYPFGLEELPDYVLIGLPASESENALIFPIAGHELGHNIWAAKDCGRLFNNEIVDQLLFLIDAERESFDQARPTLHDVDITTDTTAIALLEEIAAHIAAQIEEVFCDLIGLLLFGRSYVYAFDYLVAPVSLGTRDPDYPSDVARVRLLARYCGLLHIRVDDCEDRYQAQVLPTNEVAAYDIRLCDAVVEALWRHVFDKTLELVRDAKCELPTDEGCEHAERCFRNGYPSTTSVAFGDLFNAAWNVYTSHDVPPGLAGMGQSIPDFLTDLVVKSAELAEFGSVKC